MKKICFLLCVIANLLLAYGYENDEGEYKYRGLSGERYKYDLNNPVDKLKYETDLDTKMKDSLNMPITPGVGIDRSVGQYGGGVKGLFE